MSRTLKRILPAVAALAIAAVILFFSIPSKSGEIFTSQDGKEVRLGDFRGKVVLMNFMYTHCPNERCDTMTTLFLRIQTLLKDRLGKDFFLVSISIDPEKDTPRILREFSRKFKADTTGWFFLTSAPHVADTVSKRYGVLWKTDPDGSRHHKVVMVLLDKDGKKTKVYDDVFYDAEKIEKDVRALLIMEK